MNGIEQLTSTMPPQRGQFDGMTSPESRTYTKPATSNGTLLRIWKYLRIRSPTVHLELDQLNTSMPATSPTTRDPIVISALSLRSNLGNMLRRVRDEGRSLIVEKRGSPAAILLDIRQYVKLAAPEPEVLKAIGAEARSNKTSTLTSRQIDSIIRRTRAEKKKR